MQFLWYAELVLLSKIRIYVIEKKGSGFISGVFDPKEFDFILCMIMFMYMLG